MTRRRYDGEGARVVQAQARFCGAPGLQREAALAWAFELDVYFGRGVVDEAPEVSYCPDARARHCAHHSAGSTGVYTVRGTIRTNHPTDLRRELVEFDKTADPWCLEFCRGTFRRRMLLELAGRLGEAERWECADPAQHSPPPGEPGRG